MEKREKIGKVRFKNSAADAKPEGRLRTEPRGVDGKGSGEDC